MITRTFSPNITSQDTDNCLSIEEEFRHSSSTLCGARKASIKRFLRYVDLAVLFLAGGISTVIVSMGNRYF